MFVVELIKLVPASFGEVFIRLVGPVFLFREAQPFDMVIESPGATRRRQGVERAKTPVIFANSIKTSTAIKYLAIDRTKSDVYEKDA